MLIGRPEAARLLGVSRDTIKRLVARGVLEEFRLAAGMHPRLRREDILALAAGSSGTRPEESQPGAKP